MNPTGCLLEVISGQVFPAVDRQSDPVDEPCFVSRKNPGIVEQHAYRPEYGLSARHARFTRSQIGHVPDKKPECRSVQ